MSRRLFLITRDLGVLFPFASTLFAVVGTPSRLTKETVEKAFPAAGVQAGGFALNPRLRALLPRRCGSRGRGRRVPSFPSVPSRPPCRAVPCRAGLLPAPPARALPRPFPDPAARRRAPARAGSGSGRREGLLVLPLTWGRGRGQQGGQRRGQETHGPWGAGSRPFPLRRAGCLLSSPTDPPFSPSLSSPPLSPPFFPLSPYPPYLFALPTVRPPPELPSSFPLLLPFSFLRPEPAGMA